MRLKCPNCGAVVEAGLRQAGAVAGCPKCLRSMRIPEASMAGHDEQGEDLLPERPLRRRRSGPSGEFGIVLLSAATIAGFALWWYGTAKDESLPSNGDTPLLLYVLGVPLAIAAIAVYLLPSVIAHSRKHPNAPAITLLNLLTGWTFLGWVASIVWAMTKSTQIHHHHYHE